MAAVVALAAAVAALMVGLAVQHRSPTVDRTEGRVVENKILTTVPLSERHPDFVRGLASWFRFILLLFCAILASL